MDPVKKILLQKFKIAPYSVMVFSFGTKLSNNRVDRRSPGRVGGRRPAYPYDFGVLCTFFAPIVRLYAQQRLLYDII